MIVASSVSGDRGALDSGLGLGAEEDAEAGLGPSSPGFLSGAKELIIIIITTINIINISSRSITVSYQCSVLVGDGGAGNAHLFGSNPS